jgi:hypothetical protein
MLKAFCALRTNAAPLSLEKPRWWWLNITITIIITTITTTTITIITIITTIIIITTTIITTITEDPAFARACRGAPSPADGVRKGRTGSATLLGLFGRSSENMAVCAVENRVRRRPPFRLGG